MKRIYIALSLVLAALCFASVETGFISGKTDSFIAKIECADRLMSRLEFEDALKIFWLISENTALVITPLQ